MTYEDLDEKERLLYDLLLQMNYNLIEMKRLLEDIRSLNGVRLSPS